MAGENTKNYEQQGGDTWNVEGTLDASKGVILFPTLRTLSHAGAAAAGAVTLTGAKVGDQVLAVFGAPTAGGALVTPAAGTFEATISVADQIQQVSASNLSANTYVFILAPSS